MNEMKNEQNSCVLMGRYSVNTYFRRSACETALPVLKACRQLRNIAALWNVCSREVGNTKSTQEQLHCYAKC